jgi:hypothetical protein
MSGKFFRYKPAVKFEYYLIIIFEKLICGIFIRYFASEFTLNVNQICDKSKFKLFTVNYV